MKTEFDPTNRGFLFKNDLPEGSKRPLYSGKLNVEGKDWSIAGWIRESNGRKFISLSVQPPKQKKEDADY